MSLTPARSGYACVVFVKQDGKVLFVGSDDVIISAMGNPKDVWGS